MTIQPPKQSLSTWPLTAPTQTGGQKMRGLRIAKLDYALTWIECFRSDHYCHAERPEIPLPLVARPTERTGNIRSL